MNYLQHFDFGAPDNQGNHYALWEPVLNRFFLTFSDLQFSETIKFLASSRYKLFLIDLTTAGNYMPNLIDNICCENWTLSNREDISIIQPSRYVDAVPAKQLVPNCTSVDWDLDKEKTWLQFILVWLKFIQQLKQAHPWMAYDSFIRRIHADYELPRSENSWYTRMANLETAILQTIYLGTNLDQTHQQIIELLSQDQYVLEFYQRRMINA